MSIEYKRLVYLLGCIGEECGEVQQIVGKCLRFGVHDFNPKRDNVPNLELMRREVHDIIAVYELFLEEIGDSFVRDQGLIDYKREKTMRYFNDDTSE